MNHTKANTHQQHKFKDREGIADLQYEIWATFLRSTGDSLRNRELRLMADSAALLENYSNSKLFSREQESTDDSDSSHRQINFERDSVHRLGSPDSRILSRKSPRANNKAFNIAFYEQLKDIEDNCRPSTFKWMKNLVEQHKKIKQSLGDLSSNQKRLQRTILNYQKQHEHYLIITKVNQQAEKKIKRCQNQISELKTKNKALLDQISHIQTKNQQSIVLDEKALSNLTNYLTDKERGINIKMNKIITIEENVLQIVHSRILESGCEKCCSFIKRIKDTLFKMRSSLLEESEQIENIYNRYKAVFCGGSY